MRNTQARLIAGSLLAALISSSCSSSTSDKKAEVPKAAAVHSTEKEVGNSAGGYAVGALRQYNTSLGAPCHDSSLPSSARFSARAAPIASPSGAGNKSSKD